MFGWRRKPGSAPAAGPAVPPETRSLDDWRTLPPPPTVLRSPVTTVATSAFSAGLSAWRNPSFLSSLGHRIDGDGPAGLIAGLARPATSPGPLTYHHDRPLSPAGGRGASLQRSVAFWSPPPAAPSRLVAAPEVDLGPVPVPVVSADPAETRTETVVAPDQETPPPPRRCPIHRPPAPHRTRSSQPPRRCLPMQMKPRRQSRCRLAAGWTWPRIRFNPLRPIAALPTSPRSGRRRRPRRIRRRDTGWASALR